jgi:uncharacterized membrane protein (DUF485 family)
MSVTASAVHEIIASDRFKSLVRRRTLVSTVLTAIMLFVYVGFILSIAFSRDLLATPIAPHLPIGLLLGIGMILFAWLLTGYYTRWANRSYDHHVRELRNKLLEQ